MKKGALSLQLIVTAIILLIVVVVVIAFFAGKFSGFSSEVSSCSAKGGTCLPANECSFDAGQSTLGKLNCEGDEICCAKIGAGQ